MSEAVPQQLYDEAAELNLRIYSDWAAWEDVIQWADSWINRLETWPDELTEISLNGRHKDSGARAALAQLADRGSFDVTKLIRQQLTALNVGKSPHEVIRSLYPLTYDEFHTGGHVYQLLTPEPLRTAIYKLDYAQDSIDPEYGWADTRGLEANAWLSDEIKRELEEALAEVTGAEESK